MAKNRAEKSRKQGRQGFIPRSLPNYLPVSARKPNINALRQWSWKDEQIWQGLRGRSHHRGKKTKIYSKLLNKRQNEGWKWKQWLEADHSHQIHWGGLARTLHAPPTKVSSDALLPPSCSQTPDLPNPRWKIQHNLIHGGANIHVPPPKKPVGNLGGTVGLGFS